MTTEGNIRGIVDALEPAARAELLLVLTSPGDIRADVIRQFSERPGGDVMAELLIYLEEWEWASRAMIEELTRER